jgi:hypothetical protein
MAFSVRGIDPEGAERRMIVSLTIFTWSSGFSEGAGEAFAFCEGGTLDAPRPSFVSSAIVAPAASDARGEAFFLGPRRICCLYREIIPSFLVYFLKNDWDNIALFHCVRDSLDAERSDFGDMHQSFGVRADFDERAEIHKARHFSFESLARLVLAGKVVNFFVGSFRGAVRSRNEDGAVFFDGDIGCARFLADAVYGFTAGADDEPYLVFLDDEREDFRRARIRESEGALYGPERMPRQAPRAGRLRLSHPFGRR